MICPNAMSDEARMCQTFNGPYVPSVFQQVEYCRSSYYIKCPLFLGYQYARKRFGCPGAPCGRS